MAPLQRTKHVLVSRYFDILKEKIRIFKRSSLMKPSSAMSSYIKSKGAHAIHKLFLAYILTMHVKSRSSSYLEIRSSIFLVVAFSVKTTLTIDKKTLIL